MTFEDAIIKVAPPSILRRAAIVFLLHKGKSKAVSTVEIIQQLQGVRVLHGVSKRTIERELAGLLKNKTVKGEWRARTRFWWS